MDGRDFRNAVIDAIKYMAIFEKPVCVFDKPIEVEYGINKEKKKAIPVICFTEKYEEDKSQFS